jgi:hypothetical protein
LAVVFANWKVDRLFWEPLMVKVDRSKFSMKTAEPIGQIYSSQNNQYFGADYGQLPGGLEERFYAVDRLLLGQDLVYLGQLTCSQFAHVRVYAYATKDGIINVSVMEGNLQLQGIDCVSKFADNSFLTTTNVRIFQKAYENQGLFRTSLPDMDVMTLLQKHRESLLGYEARCGVVQPSFIDLRSTAQMVEEYTLRQKNKGGHSVIQWVSGLVIVIAKLIKSFG